MEQSARRRPRRRPLETCGGVLLSMARVVYTRNQTFKKKKNLASWFLQKLFAFVIFFVSLTSPFHRHLLAVLSVFDDHILAFQDAVETYFPSSTFVFAKMFDLLIVVETLPERFDGFLKILPGSMNRVVWLDLVLVHVISWLGLLVNVLGRWRDKNKGTMEKEITVDRSFSRSGSVSQEEEDEAEKEKLWTEGKKATYKEALQRGSSGEDGGGSTGRSNSSRGDPILELFETGWIQNPIKRSSRSADSLTFSRSDSYST
ncbi:PREDICTED: uncharacterized protein LOC104701356 [Camelina sativa]|uniref:Uncharacterized protein LOC104701356 n=1 Tax=Camelina sativa TaxID=90675 RepID=A0ABM0SS18_CAMSA|nr:PREDICTED: uncharacterized protein LOC104701356 [Camelina sativa]